MRRCWRSPTSSTSSRRTRSGTRGRSPSSLPRRRRGSGLARPTSRMLRRAGLVHGFGRLGISNAIWDKRGPLGAGEWERVRLHPYLTERMLRQSAALAPLGRDRRAAPRASRRLRLPARALTAPAISRAGADPRRRRRLPGDARAAPVPRRRSTAERRPPSCAPTSGPVGSTPTPSRRCSERPGTGAAPARGPGRADPARGRGPAAAGARALEQGDRARGW